MAFQLLTWERFITTNLDPCGVESKFEDLCRQLFINEYLSQNKLVKYVHSNPNNPGLECDPVFDEVNQRWLGYQAKFFTQRPGYTQLRESMEKVVKYYAGKVDCVILYCNKSLSTRAKDYKKAKEILNENHISLEVVTADSILDQVRKYPYLSSFYFSVHPITHEWIAEHDRHMFEALGERFHREFNVDTEFSLQLSLFVRDEQAIKYINSKKETLLSEIDGLIYPYAEYRSYFNAVKAAVHDIADIEYDTIEDSCQWEKYVRDAVKDESEKLKAIKAEQEKLRSGMQEEEPSAAADSESTKKELRRKYLELTKRIDTIEQLLNLPGRLTLSETEKQLITGKILAVTGEAGIGKSQLLAYETDSLLKNRRDALLLLAGLYFSDEAVCIQIMKNCGLDFSFYELIDILEAMGEIQERIIPVFIDALNETWTYELWKPALPRIIDKIEACKYVRLAFSFRTEYRPQILNEALSEKLENHSVCHISHRGFERNGIEAAKKFFSYYKIPFTPAEYFAFEMENPLFLTLYCRTYQGDDASLPVLYERLISDANRNIHKGMKQSLKILGYSEADDILSPFVSELAGRLVREHARTASQKELMGLDYWGKYRITPPPFIRQAVEEHVLHDYASRNKERRYYFAYDQMVDYFGAKAIVEQAESEIQLREKLLHDILMEEDGQTVNFSNEDLFIHACVLYRAKYGKECIDLADECDDGLEKDGLIRRYIQSFQWRDDSTVSRKEFLELLQKYEADIEDVWKILIGNSVKTAHPLNAEFLHELLMGYELNERDYLWTLYINNIFSDETNRITQLIQDYVRGEPVAMKSKKQTELLLTLFSWLLTSSDRTFRDYTSKAMIEIMKEDFDLCEVILRKFENVNDPYVIQRLYGVVFGACCKRKEAQLNVFQSLAEYVYTEIFAQKTVYPDILLRDYARLIIERFLWERADYVGVIDRSIIAPPYVSDALPDVKKDYTKVERDDGVERILSSMRFDGMGTYGDFGRYVFQRALDGFEVDERQIFNYAMSFIIDKLGYRNDWFADFDLHRKNYIYYQYNTRKVERIGKKYQWIAMYNILARVSDNYKMKRKCSLENNAETSFEGAWEPCVRDFDPTLNYNFMHCPQAPLFKQFETCITEAQKENTQVKERGESEYAAWMNRKGVFIQNLKDTVILTDERGTQWVSLNQQLNTGQDNLREKRLLIFGWLDAYFVTAEQEAAFTQCADKKADLRSSDLSLHSQIYTVFNREYPWSPSCKSVKEWAWREAHIKTGEKSSAIRGAGIDTILRKMGYLSDEESGYEETVIEVEAEKDMGKVLSATLNFLWEEEFDASKEASISWSVPCAELIELLQLRQLEEDGFYYDKEGKLAAFDTNLTQHIGGVVIRKELLDEFLRKSGLKIIWIVNARKEIHNENVSISRSNEWIGLLTYGTGYVAGSVYRISGGRN